MIGSIFKSTNNSSQKNDPKQTHVPTSLGRRDSSAFNRNQNTNADDQINASSMLRFQQELTNTLQQNSRYGGSKLRDPNQILGKGEFNILVE
jgi:hypothetical protein